MLGSIRAQRIKMVAYHVPSFATLFVKNSINLMNEVIKPLQQVNTHSIS